MAKRIEKETYKIERVREPMSREQLDKLYDKFKSDDDYLNYHLDTIKDSSYKYKVVIMNDENEKPVEAFKNKHTRKVLDDSNEISSLSYVDKDEASEFLEDCINENRVSSKPRAVMQDGLNRKSIERYEELVERERMECGAVVEFTKPTFEEMYDTIYVNTYNGDTYNQKESDIPDDLREDVGVIIPGMIETREEYFEFVKRLKDRGKNGLGRAIYERYEDYEDATDLIEKYKQALYDKYGGEDEFHNAKAMGGMFGAYEYYPKVKPRFKKTARNIKLDKGINVNELALVKDMAQRIREEYDDEISQIEVSHDYIVYEDTPPKFKDLPEDLKMFYATDKYDMNGFDVLKHIELTDSEYKKRLIKEGKTIEADILTENAMNEKLLAEDLVYESPIQAKMVEDDELTLESLASQCQFDKMVALYPGEYEDKVYQDVTSKGFKEFVKYQIADEYDDIDNNYSAKSVIEHAVKYAYDTAYREREQENMRINSIDVGMNQAASFGNREARQNARKGDDTITTFIKNTIVDANKRIENLHSNADNVNQSAYSRRDIATNGTNYHSQQLGDNDISMISVNATPEDIFEYVVDNEAFMKAIYELSSGKEKVDEMFSERVKLDEFVENLLKDNKPIFTESMIENSLNKK